jgi:hypothetical protein
MKKTKENKFNWDLIIKLISVLLTFGIIFYVVKILTSDLSKILGAGANAIGSLGTAFSSCFNCTNSTDNNGKKIDPKQACPNTGTPLFNQDCGGLLGVSAFALIAAFMFIAGLAGFKIRSKAAEAAKLQGNISDEKIYKSAKQSISELDDEIAKNGDNIGDSYRDDLERTQFESKWNADHPTDKVPNDLTKEDFDNWVKSKGDAATTLQTELRTTINKEYTNTKIFDLIRPSKVYNGLLKTAQAEGSSSEQLSEMQQTFMTESAEQGAAMAKKASLDEDAAADMAKRANDPEIENKSTWEKAAE